MTDEQRKKCSDIIHSASLAAAGAGTGLAQLPRADTAVLLSIQVGMIIDLGGVFGLQITDAAAKRIALAVTGTLAGRALSQVLIGWIPMIGNALNAVSAASITEAVGWVAAKRFASGEFGAATVGGVAKAVGAGEVRKPRQIAVRVAIDADTPAHEAAVIRAVRSVVETVGFVNDDDAA